MPKFELEIAARPNETARLIDRQLRAAGLNLTDSSTYEVGGAVAALQVWGKLSVLVIGSGQHTTVTAISESVEDTALVESVFCGGSVS